MNKFTEVLALLKRDNLHQMGARVESDLQNFHRSLELLGDLLTHSSVGMILVEVWQEITVKARDLLEADRATIYLLNETTQEFWAMCLQDEKGNPVEVRFPATAGIIGEATTFKKIINIPYDFEDDPRGIFLKHKQGPRYRIYTMLVVPVLHPTTGEVVAVCQFMNKLKRHFNREDPFEDKIDKIGFSGEDERIARWFAPCIWALLEPCNRLQIIAQKQQAEKKLRNAIYTLFQARLDIALVLQTAMHELKYLMHCDRATVWVLDEAKNELWTYIPICNQFKEIRIPRDLGFAGRVAQSEKTLNIPFDLYEYPFPNRPIDRKTGYRTCSLLCMPIFNLDSKLIGVTQLINKTKPGDYPPYNPEDWPTAPEQWKISFTLEDQEGVQKFNAHLGVILQNALDFAQIQQEQESLQQKF